MIQTAMPLRQSLSLGGSDARGGSLEAKIDHRYAVVVGVDHYVESGLQLRYCGNDARAMTAALTNLGYSMISLSDSEADESRHPSLANLRGTLAGLKGRFNDNELLLVTSPGHGALVNGQPCLLAPRLAERRSSEHGTAAQRRRAVRVGQWFASSHPHLGCYLPRPASTSAEAGGPTMATGLDPSVVHSALDLGEGFIVLAGSSAAQRAQDDDAKQHGVFTFYILQALAGKADSASPPKGCVTVDDLRDYVLAAVRAWCFENMADLQLPTARIEGVGDMIVAYTQTTMPKKA